MTADASSHRAITLDRIAHTRYTATNARGGQITVGSGDDDSFSPVELLLVAIGGCTAIDVDLMTSRRSEPGQFQVEVGAEKRKDPQGRNSLSDILVTFRVTFPEGEAGDKARAVLPEVAQLSHDRLCTVGVTVEKGTPIAHVIALPA
jgi:putative redox protein